MPLDKSIIFNLIGDIKLQNNKKAIEKTDIKIDKKEIILVIFLTPEISIEEQTVIEKQIKSRLKALEYSKLSIIFSYIMEKQSTNHNTTLKENGENLKSDQFANKNFNRPQYKPNQTNKIIIVASGKGGVGKSTISAALAQNLAHKGGKIGLVDADIYGPSIPRIFGIKNQKHEFVNKKIQPILSQGIEIVSMGLLIDDKPVAWRGPMASKALHQLILSTNWSPIDVMVIDTPPGTSDIHISLLENYVISGAVIVSTRSMLSQQAAEKTIQLYLQFGIRIYGIIENMHLNDDNTDFYLPGKYDLPVLEKVNFQQQVINYCDQGINLKTILDFTNAASLVLPE